MAQECSGRKGTLLVEQDQRDRAACEDHGEGLEGNVDQQGNSRIWERSEVFSNVTETLPCRYFLDSGKLCKPCAELLRQGNCSINVCSLQSRWKGNSLVQHTALAQSPLLFLSPFILLEQTEEGRLCYQCLKQPAVQTGILKLYGKSSGAKVATSCRTKLYPVNSAGVICGLTNLKDKQEDLEFLTFQNVSF